MYFLSASVSAQVGVNTTEPKAGLEVKSSPEDLTVTDGIIAPKLHGNELKAKDGLYGTDQTGTIIYVTAASSDAGVANAKTTNVTEAGYYYFNGTLWQKIADGAVSGPEPWQIQNTVNPATENTQNIYQQGRVAIGHTAADPVSEKQFDVKGTYTLNHTLDGFHQVITTPIISTDWAGTEYTDPGILEYVGNTTDVFKMISYPDRDCPDCTENFQVISMFPFNNQLLLKAADYGGRTSADLSLDNRGSLESTVYRYNDPDYRARTNFGLYGVRAELFATMRSTPDSTPMHQDPNAAESGIIVDPRSLELRSTKEIRLSNNGNNVLWPTNQPAVGKVLKINGLGINGVDYTSSWEDNNATPNVWQIQNTVNPATENTQNIYRQGKVAIGYTEADPVSNYQLEVKGNFNAAATDTTTGVSTNVTINPNINNIEYTGFSLNTGIGSEINYEIDAPNTSYYSISAIKGDGLRINARDKQNDSGYTINTTNGEGSYNGFATIDMDVFSGPVDNNKYATLQLMPGSTEFGVGDSGVSSFINFSRDEILIGTRNTSGINSRGVWPNNPPESNGQVLTVQNLSTGTNNSSYEMVWKNPDADIRFVGGNNHISQDAGLNGTGTVNTQTASGNVVIGNQSLKTGMGTANISLGANNLTKTTSQTNVNIAIGGASLMNVTGESKYNIGIGFESLVEYTGSTIPPTGEQGFNVAVGTTSLSGLKTGQVNTAYGTSSGVYLTSGNDNTFLGGNSGVAAAGGRSVTTNNSIMIGNYSAFIDNTSDNQLSIGNWIYGKNGRVGIGGYTGSGWETNPRPMPKATLHIIKYAADLTPVIIEGCQEYTDNAEAIAAGLQVGGLYRTGDVLKVVH